MPGAGANDVEGQEAQAVVLCRAHCGNLAGGSLFCSAEDFKGYIAPGYLSVCDNGRRAHHPARRTNKVLAIQDTRLAVTMSFCYSFPLTTFPAKHILLFVSLSNK
jgi:hypothetical protein